MTRRLALYLAALAILAALLVVTAPPASATHTTATALNTNEALLRDNIRAHRGWLSTTPSLNHIAHERALELYYEYRRTGGISHAGFSHGRVDGCWDLVGEIIGVVEPDPPVTYTAAGAWIVGQWHASPSHEAILHASWAERMGVGVVGNADLGRFYVAYFGDRC